MREHSLKVISAHNIASENYLDNLFSFTSSGVQKAYKEGREIEVSSNSVLFINRMWENRTGDLL